MWGDDLVTVSREVEVTQVPYGYTGMLQAGSEVRITQALGGWFTVLADDGEMWRVAGKDADAIGKDPDLQVEGPPPEVENIEDVEKLVWAQLRTCYDPEIPVNIADLGLIYGCQVTPVGEMEHKVDIKMTLTAPGCGMGEILKIEVENKVIKIPTVKDVDVELVFDPPWDISMMPEAAKLQLGLL